MAAADDTTVAASHHLAIDRWTSRGNSREDPLAAWERARPLDIPQGRTSGAYPPLPGHDEARIDPQTMTVLFRRDGVLTTCYDLTRVTTFHGHAARAAVESQYPELIA